VPTWNYTAVHASGVCRLVTDPAAVAAILTDTVTAYEQGMPQPWSIDPDGAYFRGVAAGVVGFEVAIDRLEGKFKLSQNQPADRRDRVARALLASDDPTAREVGRLMTEPGADKSG
jgi:transcriptional regulator